MTENELVLQAESDITDILRKLEAEAGMLVESVDIQMDDGSAENSSEYVKCLKLRLKDKPGGYER